MACITIVTVVVDGVQLVGQRWQGCGHLQLQSCSVIQLQLAPPPRGQELGRSLREGVGAWQVQPLPVTFQVVIALAAPDDIIGSDIPCVGALPFPNPRKKMKRFRSWSALQTRSAYCSFSVRRVRK